MAKKRQNYQKFQSTKGGRMDAIYFDMMESKAWGELSGNDIKLYLYMLKKYSANYVKYVYINSNKNNISIPKKEYLGLDESQLWTIKMGMSTFQNSIDNLIKLGFVKVVEYRYATRECNIYGFSDMWSYYGTEKFVIKNEWKRGVSRGCT